MANPNIVNVGRIFANNAGFNLRNTVETVVLNNPASSSKVQKINAISVANANSANAVLVTVKTHSQDDAGGTDYLVVKSAVIPVGGSLIVVSKDNSLYLKEDQSVSVTSGSGGTAGGLDVFVSWEDIL